MDIFWEPEHFERLLSYYSTKRISFNYLYLGVSVKIGKFSSNDLGGHNVYILIDSSGKEFNKEVHCRNTSELGKMMEKSAKEIGRDKMEERIA